MSTTVGGVVGTPRVAVLERRGKFLVAEPFFDSGPRLVVSRDRRFAVGDLVVVRAGRNARGRGVAGVVASRSRAALAVRRSRVT